MNLEDLKKSVSQMPSEDLMKLLTEIRISRRTFKGKPAKSKVDTSNTTMESLNEMIANFSTEDKKKLLEMMEE